MSKYFEMIIASEEWQPKPVKSLAESIPVKKGRKLADDQSYQSPSPYWWQ